MNAGPITIDLTKVHPDLVSLYLNAAIARHIMGWTERDSSFEECQWEDPATGDRHGAREWATSADEVLMLLYPTYWTVDQTAKTEAPLRVIVYGEHYGYGESTTFPFAACMALLRARGIKVLI